jgi:hypothetical protein
VALRKHSVQELAALRRHFVAERVALRRHCVMDLVALRKTSPEVQEDPHMHLEVQPDDLVGCTKGGAGNNHEPHNG